MIMDVLQGMGSGNSAPKASAGGRLTVSDYPLGEKSPEKLKTPTGKGINEVTIEAVLDGTVTD